eukprot:CAMPEP_0168318904 /NCGR_PEP_ID=MMETSP0213-20121227/747_1 /TAXON_ID=151035 /ORGANISM="Euplotes harpa, Strain FSP1.4" /LENGTH=107 /DNA_ID=CAMNT_0008320041 /DNA_START=162 /DNA_END=485 /DNA_ORIENTATION=-
MAAKLNELRCIRMQKEQREQEENKKWQEFKPKSGPTQTKSEVVAKKPTATAFGNNRGSQEQASLSNYEQGQDRFKDASQHNKSGEAKDKVNERPGKAGKVNEEEKLS